MEGSCVERYVLSGRIEGVDPGTMTVVVNGTVVAGTIRTPRAVYRIRSEGGGVHVVSQIDESRLPPGAEPLRLPPADVARTADAVDIPRNTESAIDVAVFHTPAARQAEGGSAGIQAVIDLMVAEINRAYDFNCETPLRFSNPGQTYAGDPLGIPGDLASGSLTGPSDAVRAPSSPCAPTSSWWRSTMTAAQTPTPASTGHWTPARTPSRQRLTSAR